jgi:NADH-quinone oxidoreductase subunit M
MSHILSIVLFTPLAAFLILLFIPSSKPRAIKIWANVASLMGFLVCLPLVFRFDLNQDFQFVEKANWIPSIGASYHLAIDGYSLLLIVLTGLLGFISILASWNAIEHRLKEYYAYFLILQVGMLGVFMAMDFLLFFVFWELVLVPMYFIIAIWGGARRVYAAIKFIIYTLVGSVLMLLGILALYFQHYMQTQVHTFNIAELIGTNLSPGIQWWIFWAFFIGFAVKVPMFPFHTWLPDAHTEAPTAGSVILASVLLKMGTYGFLRFSLPLLPDAAKNPTVVQIMAFLSIVAIVYGALVCLMQKDWKKLIAYSSVSHLGFCTLGIFALNPAGIAGSILQQINHGLSTGMLFLIVGIVYERRHTREISEYGGLLRAMPVFTIIFLITALSSMGMPPLNGFIGEITILQGEQLT